MSEKASKQALDGVRHNAFWMEPEHPHLTIVGLDIPDDETSGTFDERIFLPLDENKIKHAKAFGISDPITVRKKGGFTEVIGGRQSCRYLRAANEEIRKEGGVTWKALVMAPMKVDEFEAARLTVSLNELATRDEFQTRARKAIRLRDRYGKSEKEIAIIFGVSLKAAQTLLSYGELSPKVQKAVDKGIIFPSTACGLAEYEHAEQDERLQGLIDEAGGGKVTSSAVRRRVQADRKEKAPDDKKEDVQGVNVGRKVLIAIVEADREDKTLDPGFIKGIQFAMGNLDASQVGGLLKVLRRINKDREDNGKGVLYAAASEAAEA